MTNKVSLIVKSLIVATLGACGVLTKTQRVSEFPEHSTIITSDIQNFYKAFDIAVKDTANAKEIFEENYFSVGSSGLQDFYKSKIHSKEKFADFVIDHQNFYRSVRNNITDLADLEKEILSGFQRFEALYSGAVFPDVYFLIGRFSSNGTISKNGLLIGTEILNLTPETDTAGWNKHILRISMERSHIPVTVAHELTHFNQSGMKDGNTLLWKSIREGSAEFIAEQITGETDADFKEFKGKELKIWNDFKEDMHKSIWRPWQQASEQRPGNAGYWAGYMISKAYAERVGDKEKAVYDILNIQDYDAFYKKSNVDQFMRQNFSE